MKQLFPIFFLLLVLISCKSNECDSLDCGPNGNCDDATEACICNQFYEGTLCEKEVRERFTGAWSGTGICDNRLNNTFALNVDITPGISLDEVRIQSENILQEFTMTGSLNDEENVSIPEFMIPISSNDYDGEINFVEENSIVIILNAFVNGVKTTCTYTLSK